MRVIHLPLLAYSLSLLLSAAAGQKILGGSIVPINPLPTSTEVHSTADGTTTPTPSTSTSSSTEETSTIPTSTETESSTTSSTETTPTDVIPTSSSPSAPAETSTAPPTTTAPETHIHKTTVQVVTTIHSGKGTPVVKTLTVTSAEAQTTSDQGSTSAPGLSQTSPNGGSSGLSENEKRIVIGVVVGVGGAILIGGIMVVFWRINSRRRKAAQSDEATDLMSGTAVGTGAREKAPSPGAGATPFRSTLDQYHNPGPVNAASNF